MVDHRGLRIEEFDLEGALRRRPALILVDELAHTNAPGSRHARRWQDVQELLDAKIDVYTTLNVQHLESLNDVVAQITGVAVRETVPDSLFERADEVELVDLTPDDLLQRLREGKVYVPAEVKRAIENFFKKGNLIALREMALRRTAERVDAQMASWKQQQGVAQPWPTGERILVAIGPAPQSADLVRAACRMARRLQAPWIALSIETPDFHQLPAEDRDRIGDHLALAERLGGDSLVVAGDDAAESILSGARAAQCQPDPDRQADPRALAGSLEGLSHRSARESLRADRRDGDFAERKSRAQRPDPSDRPSRFRCGSMDGRWRPFSSRRSSAWRGDRS